MHLTARPRSDSLGVLAVSPSYLHIYRSQLSQHSLDCTSLGTVACDVAAHLPKDYLAGIVYLAALPYIEQAIMSVVGTPTILGILPHLFATNDVNDEEDGRTREVIGVVPGLFDLSCAGP